MGDAQYIRLYVNPFVGSTFTKGKKFNIRTQTRNFINNTLIKKMKKDGVVEEDTDTVNKLNTDGIPNNALKYKHHLATYIDNIHLTVFSNDRDNRDHFTIAFKDKSRIIVDYNKETPIVGKNLGFRVRMEGTTPQPDTGGNAHILRTIPPVIEQTIQPVILEVYNDEDVQPYLSHDSESRPPRPQSQESTDIIPTQVILDYEISPEREPTSDFDKLFNQLEDVEDASNLPPKEEKEERNSIKESDGEIIANRKENDLQEPVASKNKKQKTGEGKSKKRKKNKKTKKRKKNKKTKKRKNKKQKKTKKKKN